MVEMRWVERYVTEHVNKPGTTWVLQYRDVERNEHAKIVQITNWQDVPYVSPEDE